MTYVIYALLSAFFASLVAIFGKIGIKGVNSNLAVAIRTVIIVFFAWAIVLAEGTTHQLKGWSRHTWIFIILSAIATGLSWLFYYRALQLGDASRVAPIDKLSVALTVLLAFIFLGETPSYGNVLGGILVAAGVLVTVLVK
jgi:transporter family protein